MEERLQKILARAQFGSRRASEELIRQRRVAVNGHLARLGQKADPQRDTITVDGKRIELAETYTYIVLHKPPDVITTADDPWDRITVLDLVAVDVRVYPVGRLDADSEGLVLLTNDGALTHQLTHPSFEHPKEYQVLVAGQPSSGTLERLRCGVHLEDGITAPAEVDVLRHEKEGTWLRIVLYEGRKRQIRRMTDAVGHPVRRLIRVRIGPIQLRNLAPGQWRRLTRREVEQLQKAVEAAP